MPNDLPFIVAAPEHPSLDGAVVAFCSALGDEGGPVGRAAGEPARTTPALVRRLATTGIGPRLAAVHDGQILGLARIDLTAHCGPELLVAVAAAWRRRGVGTTLGRAIVARAHAMGTERIVVHTTGSPAALRALGVELGFQAVDVGRGRLDLIRAEPPVRRSA